MSEAIQFFVPGIPKPGGSKRAFIIGGRAVLTDASGKKGKDWRGDVRAVAALAYKDEPLKCPLRLVVVFTMPRPKAHYGTGKRAGVLRDDAPIWHTSKPDATKLLRSLEDALTGILWADDSLIARQSVRKVYGAATGASVWLSTDITNTTAKGSK